MNCLYQEGMEPCRQEGHIAAIHETLKELKLVLVKIAEQGILIQSQLETSKRHEKTLENIFPRITALEVKAAEERIRVGFIVALAASASSAVSGIIIKFLK